MSSNQRCTFYETGSDRRNSIRKFGYGIRGLTPVTQQLCVYGKRVSAIRVIMSVRGIKDSYIVEGSVNSDIFIERCLLPILEPFDGEKPSLTMLPFTI